MSALRKSRNIPHPIHWAGKFGAGRELTLVESSRRIEWLRLYRWHRPRSVVPRERVHLRVDAGNCGAKGAAACPPVAWFSKRRTSRGLHGRLEKRPSLTRTLTRGDDAERKASYEAIDLAITTILTAQSWQPQP
jgi:hypothetical protein